MKYDLTIVVPTFNESGNIEELIKRLKLTLSELNWELVFVDDDSTDKTADIIRKVTKDESNIRCIQRIGRRGLSSACIEGILSSNSDYYAIMDADLQHDEKILPDMYKTITKENLELVVGSRYVDGGDCGEWGNSRKFVSWFATYLAKLVTKIEIKDPMSGFFMISNEFFYNNIRKLNGKGFKILLDICSSADGVKYKELPYSFGLRESGESKLSKKVVLEYIELLADKTIGKVLPLRFILFMFVGLLGAAVHLLVLQVGFKNLEFSFIKSQAVAVCFAMTFNFVFDNMLTYRDMRLKGLAFWKGLLSFYVVCSIGAWVNLHVSKYLYNTGALWWLAGLMGAVVGAVWNYAVSKHFTWHAEK